MSKQQRVHILSAVNAGAVSVDGDTYTIAGVCGCVDDLVMNATLYPAQELAAGAASLEGKPAPAGHPKDAQGRYVSAVSGAALASAWIGSYCTNARHEGGRTLVDVVVNAKAAQAHPDGEKLVQRLADAVSGKSAEPIHVSTGLMMRAVNAAGESRGRKYSRVATAIAYDHLAILFNEAGAGTPSDGVGMFLNSAGDEEPVECGEIEAVEDRRAEAGLLRRMVNRLLGVNAADEASFGQITEALQAFLPSGAWLREVYSDHVIWCDQAGLYWRQEYAKSGESASVAFTSTPVKVDRRVEYVPVANRGSDTVKETIIAALTAAGINSAGMSDAQTLEAFQALAVKPVQDKLDAANSKIAAAEARAQAQVDAHVQALATELAANSALTVDDLKRLGLARLQELKSQRAGSEAAPLLAANAHQSGANSHAAKWAGYDINA